MENRHARVMECSGGVSPMRKSRKSYTPAEKVAILRCRLIDRVPSSDLCAKYQLQPSILHAGRSFSSRTVQWFSEDGFVRSRYNDQAHGSRKWLTRVSALEFVRRHLLHVPPRVFVRIRHDGLWSNRQRREDIALCRQLRQRRRLRSGVARAQEALRESPVGYSESVMSELWRGPHDRNRNIPAVSGCCRRDRRSRCPRGGGQFLTERSQRMRSVSVGYRDVPPLVRRDAGDARAQLRNWTQMDPQQPLLPIYQSNHEREQMGASREASRSVPVVGREIYSSRAAPSRRPALA